MKYFVIHHPALVERKKDLQSKLSERGIEAEWITDFSPEQSREIKSLINSPLHVKYVSGSMKHYTVFKKIVDEDIPHAIVFEDDTIFTEYFDVETIPKHMQYVKLCKPVGDAFCTSDGTPFVCSNNGCCDAYYLTKEFAENSLKNIQLLYPIDIEMHNTIVKFYNTPHFLCIPMCYQIGPSCTGAFTLHEESWIEYVMNTNHPVFEYVYISCVKKIFDE
jgi:GR25 family glycosyltransferase involved in LPS biosynthesis